MATTELFLLAIAIMNTFLGFMVAFGNRKDPINKWFGVFAGSIAVWAISLLIFRSADNIEIARRALNASYGAAVAIAISFYVFMRYFPNLEKFGRVERLILYVSSLFVVATLFLQRFFITDVIVRDDVRIGVQTIWGYWIFAFYFVIYFFGSLVVLFRRWKVAPMPLKRNLGFIVWSVLVAGVLGAIFNLVLPSPFFMEWRFTWLGPIFTAIIVGTLSYAIARHRLLNIRVIAAEMLSVAIIFVLFMEMLFAKTELERILRLLFFVVAGFFSSFLIRSVRKEVEQKEELGRLAKNLEFANSELKKLDIVKSEFISIASHQLRAPLTAIKGYISMLIEGTYGAVPKKAEEPLRRTFVSSQELVFLVSSLLNLSRIEAGKIQYEFKKVNLANVVFGAVQELDDVAKQEEVGAEFDKETGKSIEVSGDKNKLHEVFTNLLDNAIKYTPKGVIKIKIFESNGKAVVSFSDNGIGIGKEDMSKLFSKFGRTETSQKIRPDGMGIGLYFVKRVVEDHKGRVWAESEGADKGSTFFVELPLA